MNAPIEISGKTVSPELILQLSEAEYRVFVAMGEGMTLGEVASIKGHVLSIRTVEKYVETMKIKLHLHNSWQLRAVAAKYNLLAKQHKVVREPVPRDMSPMFRFAKAA